jgi:hypothetical protein
MFVMNRPTIFDVQWGDKKLVMFYEDVQTRSDVVDGSQDRRVNNRAVAN